MLRRSECAPGSWNLEREDFAPALLDPERPKPRNVCGPEGKAAQKRFNVYRNNVTYSLKSALGEIFPSVLKCCGEDRFSHVSSLYVRDHPPTSRLLFEYGGKFGDFLDTFEPARQQMPWLADLARLERAWLDAWHSADETPLASESLSTFAPEDMERLVFAPHSAMMVLESRFAIYDLFLAARNDQDIAAVELRNPQSVLVTRPRFDVELRLLPLGGATFFTALQAGMTLGDAAGAALAEAGDFDLASAIAALLAAGACIGAATA
jgi:hypothetical protein